MDWVQEAILFDLLNKSLSKPMYFRKVFSFFDDGFVAKTSKQITE